LCFCANNLTVINVCVWQDLSRLGRDLSQVVIIDNSPASYVLHPENAVSTALNYVYLLGIHCASENRGIPEVT